MPNKYLKYRFDNTAERNSILSACIANDRAAQERLYKHFYPVMERMILKYTKDEDQLINIVNDGFLRVFKKIQLYENKGSLEGWIRKIMYHSLSNYFRKNKRDLKFLIFEDTFSKEPKEKEKHSLFYQDLMYLVDQLPEKQMKVFLLFAVEGYSHEEISSSLDINKNTSRWYLAEARKQLQKAYLILEAHTYNEAK